MDIGELTDQILDLLQDDFIEDHLQVGNIMCGLQFDPEDVANIFGIEPLYYKLYLDELRATEEKKESLFRDYTSYDRIVIGNKILERINEVLHWKRNFNDLMESPTDDENIEIDQTDDDVGLSEDRDACLKFLRKKIPDIPINLLQQLEEEVFDYHSHRGADGAAGKRFYRGRIRAIVANFSRNDKLLGDFLRGAIPVRWLTELPEKAFATKEAKKSEQKVRKELQKEAELDPESAAIFEKAKNWKKPSNSDNEKEDNKENIDNE